MGVFHLEDVKMKLRDSSRIHPRFIQVSSKIHPGYACWMNHPVINPGSSKSAKALRWSIDFALCKTGSPVV